MNKYTSLREAVADLFGSSCAVTGRRHVSGGDINDAQALTLSDGSTLFMKSNRIGALANFEAEAEGLAAIRKTGTIGVPDVLGIGTDKKAGSSFLLLEYIEGSRRRKDFWEAFAHELAEMHRAKPADGFSGFGFPKDNWIGAREQVNTPRDTWMDFFRDCRLHPQFAAAERHLSAGDRRKADWLLSHLDRFLAEPVQPSLVHGDLWNGNMITGNDGKGWLIDPAVYYGHPEADIAMTELFGGFSQRFYDAYRETGLLLPGYEERKDLYNLYHLLNHLNIFGGGYLSSVCSILNRYANS